MESAWCNLFGMCKVIATRACVVCIMTEQLLINLPQLKELADYKGKGTL